MPKLKEAMKEGVTEGRELLERHCNFDGKSFRPSGADSTDEDEKYDEEDEVKDVAIEEGGNKVTMDGETMHFDTAVEVCLHGRSTRMPAQSTF